jgi:cytochrome c
MFFNRLLLLGAMAVLAGCDAGEKPTELPPPDRQSAARGQALLAQYQCGSCHAIPGVAASRGAVAQSLEGFSKRSYIAGRIPNNPDTLAKWIVQPSALVPDTPMPSMGVSADEAKAMAAYLHSLK